MELKNKYIRCFTKEKAEQLKEVGFKELYYKDGVFYFENNNDLTVKFSNSNLLNDTKPSMWINI